MNTFAFFFIGVLTGILLTVILMRQSRSLDDYESEEEIEIVMSQSLMYRVHELFDELMQERGPSQSELWDSEPVGIRFVQSPDDKIYWIEDDVLYCTDVGEDSFDLKDKVAVKTEELTEDELEQLLIILNILQNGS